MGDEPFFPSGFRGIAAAGGKGRFYWFAARASEKAFDAPISNAGTA
jgi:hypothetical protein